MKVMLVSKTILNSFKKVKFYFMLEPLYSHMEYKKVMELLQFSETHKGKVK